MPDLFPKDVIPIPLRPDFTARVHIPPDMTEAEARKIGAVLLALAKPEHGYALVYPRFAESPNGSRT